MYVPPPPPLPILSTNGLISSVACLVVLLAATSDARNSGIAVTGIEGVGVMADGTAAVMILVVTGR